MIARLRGWARALKREALVLWLAARDPRVPLGAKLLAGAIAAYALSPIDLIPDVIPVLGLLDDLLIVPLGIWAALRLIPPALIPEFRAAANAVAERPSSKAAALAIGLVWLIGVATLIWVIARP